MWLHHFPLDSYLKCLLSGYKEKEAHLLSIIEQFIEGMVCMQIDKENVACA